MEIIKLENVGQFFSGKRVLDNITFNVSANKIHGLLGPNGAGKTTTMKLIAGVIKNSCGTIYINGVKNPTLRKIGILLEEPALYEKLQVSEYLKYISELHKSCHSRIPYVIKKLNISEIENKLIEKLSKGQKQKVAIAGAIVFDPEILILDEPTVGLDPQAVLEMRQLIFELSKDHCILISSHILHEISILCDDITIINRGKLLFSDDKQKIENDLNSQKSYRLITAREISQHQVETLQEMFNLSIKRKKSNEKFCYEFSSLTNKDLRRDLLNEFISLGIEVLEFSLNHKTLEEFYIELIEKDNRESFN